MVAVIDYANDSIRVYVDGVEQATSGAEAFTPTATPATDSSFASIGSNETGANSFFDGQIDEARIATTVRSEDWVTAQHASMTDRFITYGYEQQAAGVLGNDIDVEGDTLTATNLDVTGTLGLVALNADGTFTYDPNGAFDYLAQGEQANDTFTYTANDGTGDSNIATVTITITGVNDAPVNTAPINQVTSEDITIVFSTGNGNAIQVGDVDSGNNPLRVTLTATNGTMTLASTLGLNFTTGTGTANASMVFSGTITNINAALQGMSYTPTLNYYGAASIQITTEDQASELFGNDTVFGSSTTAGDHDKEQIATRVTLSQNGTLTSITAYMGGIADKKDIRFGLYADAAGEPGALLVESGKVTHLAGDGWFTIELPATAVTAGDYWIGLAPGKEAALFYDAAGGQTRHSNFDPASGFADPWSGTYVSNSQQLSVYASFTPDGATAESDTDIINITINAANDAPLLDNSGSMVLPNVSMNLADSNT